MKRRTIVLAIGIVAVLIIGYWAVIGFKSPIDDFVNTWNNGLGGGGGGGGDGTTPVKYIAYATFIVSMEIVSADGNFVPMHPATGDITSFTYKVDKYVSPDQGRVYQNVPLLKGHGFPSDVWGSYWINITVLGPGGFTSYWESPHGPIILHASDDPQYCEMSTGRCMFGENGAYRAIAELRSIYNPTGEHFLLDRQTVNIQVSV